MREHVIQTILHVARLFPIIRFDAAMVLAKRHVQRLWFPLPGAGGSIPSRAENAMSQEEFDALMPHEFWREVVDRVAVEVPGTLLLAEAFWLLEGYFVRTLGMHRVYNSAFMNMLRDEENAKYRSYLKKTIEFDPDIMKRYVNFMSNPDEKTAIDQFGDGDKCFGVATLLATLPGLPMFGHGQIEGYTERYGMEYKQAKMDEWPREDLVARHQAEIAPLLKKRYIFAESENFTLYDFWTGHGTVDENVFAYSNRMGGERSIVLYNNRYESTSGCIHHSAASMDKGSGELRQRQLGDGLGVAADDALVVRFRDVVSGLEYLRRAMDVHWHGLSFPLRGYQRMVLLDWQELRSSAEYPWDRLCDELNGEGSPNLEEALSHLRLRPVHDALWSAVSAGNCRLLSDLARTSHPVAEPAGDPLLPGEKSPQSAAKTAPSTEDSLGGLPAEAARVFDRIFEALAPSQHSVMQPAKGKRATASAPRAAFEEESRALLLAAARLPEIAVTFAGDWPAAVRALLPFEDVSRGPEPTWAPVLAYVLYRSLPWQGSRVALFDQVHSRAALAEIFEALGMQGDDRWRAVARVRLLLGQTHAPEEAIASEALWSDPDARWLAGVNESGGKTYFNREQFEELWGWLQLPVLLDTARRKASAGESTVEAEIPIAGICELAAEAGYELTAFQALAAATESAHDAAVEAPVAVSAPKI